MAETESSLHEAHPMPHSESTHPRKLRRPMVLLIAAQILVNIPLLVLAAMDRSWGALGIAIVVGPIVNVLVGLLLLAVSLSMKSKTGFSTEQCFLMCAATTGGAVVLDFLIIFSMGLHGC